MKRLTAYLCALALAWAPALSSASITLMGAGKIAVVAGGGSVTFDVTWPDDATAKAEDVASLDVTAQTVASTSNRFAIAATVKNDGAETITGMRWNGSGGTAFTQLGSTELVQWHHVARFNLIADANVTSGSRTLYASYSASVSRAMAVGAVYNGVHQTTPINSTPTRTTGSFGDPTFTGTASITGTTVTGGKLVAFLSLTQTAGGGFTLSCPSVTIRREIDYIIGGLVLLERDNNGGSTQISCDITVTAGDVTWAMDAYAIQPP